MTERSARAADEENAFPPFEGDWKEATVLTTNDGSARLSWRAFLDVIQNLRTGAKTSYTRLFPEGATPATEGASASAKPATTPSSRTISYDALRGLACVGVFNLHFTSPYTQTTVYGYGVPTDKGPQLYFHQLPFIRLWAAGSASVCLFFGISGYVLSSGFLAGIRNSQNEKAVTRLSSLALRRWCRLFLPATVSMFLVALGAWMGFYDNWGHDQNHSQWMTGISEPHPPNRGSLTAQLLDFWNMWCGWTDIWNRRYWPDYDAHTWTLPVEFRGSMVLFMLLLASLRLRRRMRMTLFVFVSAYCYMTSRWEYGIFVGGALIADLHLNMAASNVEAISLPSDDLSARRMSWLRSRHLITTADWLAFVIGLYMLSFPCANGELTTGYIFMAKLTAPGTPPREIHFFWHSMAAMLLLWSIERLSLLRKTLGMRFFQYFGEISFSLYLVHGPLLHSVGYALQPKLWALTGYETMSSWLTGLALGWLIMLSMCIAVAHVFNKLVDVPLVKATRWLEGLVCEKA